MPSAARKKDPASTFSVKMMAIGKLTLYATNPRDIDERAIDDVAASIKQFGFQQPIVVSPDLVIVAGHTRYRAAQKLGLKSVPVKIMEGSEADARLYRIADNRVHEFSRWNHALLQAEIHALQEMGAPLEMTFFRPKEMDELFGVSHDGGTSLGDASQDDVPATWNIIVECQSEGEQTSVLERLMADGLNCRAVVS